MTEQVAESGGISRFIKNSLLGGVLVLLPLTLIAAFFKWLFKFLASLIQPFTDELITLYAVPDYVGHLIVIVIIVLVCFTVGNLVATRFGNWLWNALDTFLKARLPGYKAVQELVGQLMKGGAARGEVCLLKVMGRDVDITVTGMVTARHADGRLTIFVPCGPNPTTGFIYHVASELVELRPDIKVETMMKTVIGCGVGAADVLRKR